MLPPPVKKESGWEEVKLPLHIGSGRTLFTNLEQDGRMRLRVFFRPKDKHLVGRVWFGKGSDGPPGHVHGGVIAFALDEAMGAVAFMNNYPAMAAKLELQYLLMTPLYEDALIEAWIDSVSPKRLQIEAQVVLPNGKVSVKGKGEFARVSRAKFEELVGRY